MQMVLNQGQISDLFFNYDHPEYQRLYGSVARKGEDEPTREEIEQAIRRDAVEFAQCYPSTETHEDMVAWLVNDFMRRL